MDLDQRSINDALNGRYWRVTLIDKIDSTQSGIKVSNPVHGDVLVTNYQSAGRGRQDRDFEAPAGSALLFSAFVQPKRDRSEWGFIPLIAGFSVAEILGIEFYSKWPNDILSDLGKVGGILCEVHGDGVIIGIGINVAMTQDQLPVPTASSIFLTTGNAPDRSELLIKILNEIAFNLRDWEAGEDLIDDYLDSSATMGKSVSALLPDGTSIEGVAIGISAQGELLLADGSVISVGDISHLNLK